MGQTSAIFVNREEELHSIKDAVERLQDERRILRTPLIQYNGIQGIGKSTLLREARKICEAKGLKCIQMEAAQITPEQFDDVQSLAEAGPVALILDTLDAVDNAQFQVIETGLSRLMEYNRLFVILASRNVQRFEHARSISRRLMTFPLEPLQRESSFSYLQHFADTISSTMRNTIYDWTRGYPLAMEVMTEAIQERGLDPDLEQDRPQLLEILKQEVIDNNLLAKAPPNERTRLHTLLALLSIPRRFNLILTQDLIVKFAPAYKLESSLAYITLPRAINDVTNVLSWNLERAGYCIAAPVRNLFLIQYSIERPQAYLEVHKFLAQKNSEILPKVSGSDFSRYLREFFYHLASSEEPATVRGMLDQYITQLARVPIQDEHDLLSSLENFMQFYEEFKLDTDLQNTLGQNAAYALLLIFKNFVEIYRQLPAEMRGYWLKAFFALVTGQPEEANFAFHFEEGMRQIIEQISAISKSDAIKLYQELNQEKELRDLLGTTFAEVDARIHAKLVDEG